MANNANSTHAPFENDNASLKMSRRALLSSSPILALPFALPALATSHPDANILAAWERRCGAYRVLEVVSGTNIYPEPMDPREAAAWDIVDEAEKVIQLATARTPEGVAIQIWTALHHEMNDGFHDAKIAGRDVAALRADSGLDWTPKLMVAALASLSTMVG